MLLIIVAEEWELSLHKEVCTGRSSYKAVDRDAQPNKGDSIPIAGKKHWVREISHPIESRIGHTIVYVQVESQAYIDHFETNPKGWVSTYEEALLELSCT